MMKFDINHNWWYLRWKNWQDFISDKHYSQYSSSSNNIVVFVTYNNAADTVSLLKIFLTQEQSNDFDILVVDNGCWEAFEQVRQFVKQQTTKKIIHLQAIDNLWGAWWYALWLEYILSKKYNYIIITEDDAFPLQDNTISTMLRYPDKEVFIQYKELQTTSFTLHFHGYPRQLIEAAWVPDPRYFMRSDDLEYALRINKQSQKNTIEKKILNDFSYTHPVSKRWWNKLRQIYLWQKNSRYTESRWRWNLQPFIISLLYLRYGFLRSIIDRDINYIKYILLAYSDFLLCRSAYRHNKSRLSQLFVLQDVTYQSATTKHSQKISLISTIRTIIFSLQLSNHW